jgi:hypothetical protein
MTQPPRALHRALARHLADRNSREALRLVEAMRAGGVQPILLKGASTRALLELPDRPSADVDLLVAPQERRRAERVLRARGYRRHRGVHADNWTAPDAVPVDLHRSLTRLGVAPAEAWAVLAAGLEATPLAGGSVDVLSRPAQLVHLCLHVTSDESGRATGELRRALAVCDQSHWQAVRDLAGRLGASASVEWALRQVGAAWASGPADELALPANDLSRGIGAFVRSPVHWSERRRRQTRLTEAWVRWQAGRIGRLLNGRSDLYHRLRLRLRLRLRQHTR